MPRIGLDFVLRHASDVRDPFPSPHPWYVLFELSSPREGEELQRLAETVLDEGLKTREIDGGGHRRLRWRRAPRCGARAS